MGDVDVSNPISPSMTHLFYIHANAYVTSVVAYIVRQFNSISIMSN